MIALNGVQPLHAANRHATMSSLRAALIWNVQRQDTHDSPTCNYKEAALQTDQPQNPVVTHLYDAQ